MSWTVKYTNQAREDIKAMRFKLYEDEPWKSKGLRFVPVDNYLIFYLPIDETNTVSIVRIIYAGRDMNKQLQETEI